MVELMIGFYKHPTTPNVRIIEYKVPALRSDELTSGALKGLNSRTPFTKTIYDPTIWTDVKLKKALMEAMADKMRSAEGIVDGGRVPNQGVTLDGYKVDFHYREGEVTTFFFNEN